MIAGISEVLLDEAAIRNRVGELGRQIALDYRGREPVVIGVLRGAVVFMADLIRYLEPRIRIDFIAVSSYGAATTSSGEVKLTKDLESGILGEHVILVEDIVDTGLTLDYLLRLLHSRKPASLAVASLLSKPSRRRIEVPVDYLGFEIPDRFVVGYGLDYRQHFRNLPVIGIPDDINVLPPHAP